MFENADEPVMVVASPKRTTQVKRQSTNKRRGAMGRQPDLFSSAIQQPYTPPITNRTANGSQSTNGKKQATTGDQLSGLNGNGQAEQPTLDRKRVVKGKSVADGVDPGVARTIK